MIQVEPLCCEIVTAVNVSTLCKRSLVQEKRVSETATFKTYSILLLITFFHSQAQTEVQTTWGLVGKTSEL